MDNEFERLRYELRNAYIRLAEAQAVLKQYEDMLTAEMTKPEEERHSAALIQTQISNTKLQIEQIKAQINDLTESSPRKRNNTAFNLTFAEPTDSKSIKQIKPGNQRYPYARTSSSK